MMISLFLTAIFLFMFFIIKNLIKGIVITSIVAVILIIATILIWFPSLSTSVANFFGIGRGVDFILILLSVFLANGFLLLIAYLLRLRASLTAMARHIALSEAKSPIVPTTDQI